MARQNPTSTEAETTEAPVEVTETETTETEQAPSEQAEAPAEDKPEVNIESFVAALEEAFGMGDEQTGALPEDAIAKINQAYTDLDGNGNKAAARKHLDEGIMAAVISDEPVRARNFGEAKKNLSAGTTSKKSTAKPADPTEAYVQRMAAATLAQHVIVADFPEGADVDDVQARIAKVVEDNSQSLQDQLAWLANESEDKGEAPEMSAVLRAAFKSASGKGGVRKTGGSTGGPRGNVAKHITEVFADLSSGDFLTVNEIVKKGSSEYAPGAASQGAVSARLFPASGTCTVEGVVPVNKGEHNGSNPKGAKKA